MNNEKKIIEKTNRYSLVFHIICWMMVFVPQMLVVPRSQQGNYQFMLMRGVLPLSMCITFYINYLLLVPKGIFKKKYFTFGVFNLLIIVIFSVCNRLTWLSMMQMDNTISTIDITQQSVANQIAIFLVRVIFPLITVILLALLLRLSLRWMEAERDKRNAELQRKDAELKSLRMQISPHFLLNTLNNIYALIEFDQHKAQKAVESLSQMLRHMLYGNKEERINLKEEINLLDNYIDVMRLRFKDNVMIEVNKDIPEPCNVYIAPLLCISMIENAFKHGVSTTEPSFIKVNIHATDDCIEYEIVNSNFPKTSKDKSGHGIGLNQLQSRLDILYPQKYHWEKGVDVKKNIYHSKLTIYDTELRNN